MDSIDANAMATGLARFVRDFLPRGVYGVVLAGVDPEDGALLGVYGKPGGRGLARTELAVYEALLDQVRVEVAGRGFSRAGESWAMIVRAGRLVHPLRALLTDILGRRIADTKGGGPTIDWNVADQRVREWCGWWSSLSG